MKIPHVHIQPDGRARVDESFEVTIAYGWALIVPEGFTTDGASIPWWAQPIIGPPIRDRHFYPALVHDFLCSRAENYEQRALGDAAFHLLLRRAGVPYWRRAVMYVAVRLHGRLFWKHTAKG